MYNLSVDTQRHISLVTPAQLTHLLELYYRINRVDIFRATVTLSAMANTHIDAIYYAHIFRVLLFQNPCRLFYPICRASARRPSHSTTDTDILINSETPQRIVYVLTNLICETGTVDERGMKIHNQAKDILYFRLFFRI